MSASDDYLPTASSTNSSDTSYPSNREEMEVVSKVQPLEGELRQTQISTKTDKDGLSPARLKQKTPVTEFLLRCVCVLFSVAKSYKDWVDVFVSVAISYYYHIKCGRRFPLVSAQIANNFLSKNCNENKREVAHTR